MIALKKSASHVRDDQSSRIEVRWPRV